jgi:hypothetical protein
MKPDGTPLGETTMDEQVSNNAPTTATLTSEEVAELRKTVEQAQLRARQLENEAKARKEADEKAANKKLADDEEYRELAARAQARVDELERSQEESAKRATVSAAETAIMTEFPSEVTELALTTGLVLTDDTDEAKAAFKAKLDAIAAKVAPTKRVVGNNGVITPIPSAEAERAKDLIRMRADKASGFRAIGNLEAIKQMERNAGVSREEV